jgi:hypothetical protein
VEGAPAARVAFAIPARPSERLIDWAARAAQRLGVRVGDGWRTV